MVVSVALLTFSKFNHRYPQTHFSPLYFLWFCHSIRNHGGIIVVLHRGKGNLAECNLGDLNSNVKSFVHLGEGSGKSLEAVRKNVAVLLNAQHCPQYTRGHSWALVVKQCMRTRKKVQVTGIRAAICRRPTWGSDSPIPSDISTGCQSVKQTETKLAVA